MTKIEFYTAVKDSTTFGDFEEVESLIIDHFEGFTMTYGTGIYKREPAEECYIYSVLTPWSVDQKTVVSIARRIALIFQQESVLYFVTQGEGGFS